MMSFWLHFIVFTPFVYCVVCCYMCILDGEIWMGASVRLNTSRESYIESVVSVAIDEVVCVGGRFSGRGP